ncbi:4Fe-4S ferredoxin iron-sulfur binding domain protein [uncultured Desulfobacterium sp.]|uniref:4Fe-4S ferredoxin iron-sulfur binding domain protein n=1 Tax=uncultured Desulfobacterium sp. TaxID=201089 RepID=A0A445MRT0_9BACT|nr:4Fe-4S ferredoxin iron-sulfur binding domain protein [uncultured Desulfobacterium sp.]
MNGISQMWKNISGLWSLIVGLKITGKYFVCPQVTVHYPRKTVDNLSTFRGPVELVASDNDPTKPKCIVCLQCAGACPSGCLTVAAKPAPKPTAEEIKAKKEAEAKGEKVKKAAPKELGTFRYDFTLCSLCGTCVDTCPVGSLQFSSDAYLASRNKEDFVYDLLARLADQAKGIKSGSSQSKE